MLPSSSAFQLVRADAAAGHFTQWQQRLRIAYGQQTVAVIDIVVGGVQLAVRQNAVAKAVAVVRVVVPRQLLAAAPVEAGDLVAGAAGKDQAFAGSGRVQLQVVAALGQRQQAAGTGQAGTVLVAANVAGRDDGWLVCFASPAAQRQCGQGKGAGLQQLAAGELSRHRIH